MVASGWGDGTDTRLAQETPRNHPNTAPSLLYMGILEPFDLQGTSGCDRNKSSYMFSRCTESSFFWCHPGGHCEAHSYPPSPDPSSPTHAVGPGMRTPTAWPHLPAPYLPDVFSKLTVPWLHPHREAQRDISNRRLPDVGPAASHGFSICPGKSSRYLWSKLFPLAVLLGTIARPHGPAGAAVCKSLHVHPARDR